MTEEILTIKNLKKYYDVNKSIFSRTNEYVHAVDDVSFSVKKGYTLGIVGESGCGKTTVGKSIVKLLDPTAGQIIYKKQDISQYSRKQMKPLRKELQIIFQDPFSSLNPRFTVRNIVGAFLDVHRIGTKTDRDKNIAQVLDKVGINPDYMNRYPHEFSGGQRQRIGIARALTANPQLIVADEPVSALDVSVQAQVINLLQDLKKELNLTYIMISHDLAVINQMADEVMVMYLGKIVEKSNVDHLLDQPLHPYTQALLSAIPIPDPDQKRDQVILQGDVPSPIHPPSGCCFHPRCPHCMDRCCYEKPELINVGKNHLVACFLHSSKC
jgi:oligopeptide transport system ATP-binding protein